jgi:hypothetical protein
VQLVQDCFAVVIFVLVVVTARVVTVIVLLVQLGTQHFLFVLQPVLVKSDIL